MFIELEPVFNNIGEKLDFNYSLDLSRLQIGLGFPFEKPIVVSGSVFNRAGVVRLEAEAEVLMSAPCDLCAAPTQKRSIVPVSHILVTSLNDEENDDEFVLVEEMRFDLDELVREDIILSLPARFVCRDDCKGLCPQCGKNLNEGSCSCKAEGDPRLAALAQLLDDTE